jgi:hypothetical protein
MYSPKTVELWNYYKLNPKFAPCNELVEDALKQLHNRYKNDYIFASVRGSEPTFFHPRAVPGITQPGHHYYLLGWRIEDNTDVENALRKNSKTIPPQTLVIDPTFQKVMRASEASGYTMATKPDTTLYLRTQPSTDLRLPFSTNERRSTSYLPLGTLQRLVPELGNREPEQMLYWYFQQKQNPAEPPIMRLARQSPHGEIRDWPNWKDDIAAVSPNNALLLLAAKIEADFEEPDTLAQKGQRLLRGIIKALT